MAKRKVATVGDLLKKEPDQWGLRGDPFLWAELREHLKEVPIPPTADELVGLLAATFRKLTGHEVSDTDHFFVERFAHGGMSSGFIAPDFWRERALPLLRSRHPAA